MNLSYGRLATIWTLVVLNIIALIVMDSFVYEPFRWKDTAAIALGALSWMEALYGEYKEYHVLGYRQTPFKVRREVEPERFRKATVRSEIIGTIFITFGLGLKLYGWYLTM